MLSSQALDEKDVAHLRARFIVPLIAQDMIEDKEVLDDVAEYAIHDIMSEFKPDAALLCIALCAEIIAQTHQTHYMARLLSMEAEKLLSEYGPVWLSHERGDRGLPQEADLERLVGHIPEDLEMIAQMLEDFIAVVGDDHAIPAILADILSLQASMHRDLALVEIRNIYKDIENPADDNIREYVSSMHHVTIGENGELIEAAPGGLEASAPAGLSRQEQFLEYGDNVLLFPSGKGA